MRSPIVVGGSGLLARFFLVQIVRAAGGADDFDATTEPVGHSEV